jgi:hypothetical protein
VHHHFRKKEDHGRGEDSHGINTSIIIDHGNKQGEIQNIILNCGKIR